MRADVPILALFLGIDRPYLTKEVPIHRPPEVPPTYTFEWFDVVRPDDFDRDAKKVQAHVDALYEARFGQQLLLQAELREEPASAAA